MTKELYKTNENGQWEILEKKDLARTETTVHYADGSKKKFTYRHQAVSHVMSQGHLPHDNSYTTFYHENDQSDRKQTLRIESPADRRKMRQANSPKRRISD